MRVFIELLIDGCLLLCFIVQAFILGCLFAYGYLPLPAAWVSRNITQQLPPGLSLRAESYALRLNGTLRIGQPEIHLDGIEQALFRAAEAEAGIGIRRQGQAPLYLRECTLLEGLLALPAVYSPDGRDSPLLQNISLHFMPTAEGISVDSFAARHEDLLLRGTIDWSFNQSSAKSFDLRQSADRWFQQANRLLQQKEKLDGFTRPTVLFQMHAADDGAAHLQARVSSRSYQHPRMQASQLILDARFAFNGQQVTSTAPLQFQADELQLPEHRIRATGVRAILEPDAWNRLLQGHWPNVELLAARLESHGIALDTPRLRLDAQAFPELAFSGLASGLQGAAAFSGSLNTQTRAARIQAAGSLDLWQLLPRQWADHLPALNMVRPPHYQLKLTFGPGFKLQDGELCGQADALHVDGLRLDHLRFQGTYQQGQLTLQQAYLRRDWQWLKLGLQLDPASDDYTLTLKGSARPDDYNPLLPRWWGEIFRDFDFSTMAGGLGDFVIYGNTRDRAAGFFFGHAAARNIAYKNVPVDAAGLIVRGRGPYAEVHQLEARSGAGYVRGDIRFTSRLDAVPGPMSVRFDLESQLPLADYVQLFDDSIAGILTDFETDVLPRSQLQAAVFNPAYPEFDGLSHFDLVVDCPGPLHYKGLPLDELGFTLQGRKDISYLRGLQFGYAGGRAQASADIVTSGNGPARTRFQLSLADAQLAQAINGVQALKAPQDADPSQQTQADSGRLDLKLHAAGPVNNLLQFQGYGNFQLEDEALYAIQLFGPLSKLLENTRLGFTSFALDEMVGDFVLNKERIHFQQIDINGPRTRIEALGTLGLEDEALAMRVSVYLFGNAGNPQSRLRQISDFITRPIPNILEFELSGSVQDQKWRSLYDPRQFIPRF